MHYNSQSHLSDSLIRFLRYLTKRLLKGKYSRALLANYSRLPIVMEHPLDGRVFFQSDLRIVLLISLMIF